MIEADDGPRKSARVSKLTATKATATKDKNTILNNKIIKETPSLEEETKIHPDDYGPLLLVCSLISLSIIVLNNFTLHLQCVSEISGVAASEALPPVCFFPFYFCCSLSLMYILEGEAAEDVASHNASERVCNICKRV